ncbi:ScbR family autoregulator-binding transcription factor [Streptomyces sp. NPDC091272]|uniref:ScbR family autoregulator-binding transcription factor n=1 Tax=Streptomyces sp. NPDC091272 TaxID=3365981 RepID=UPI003823DAE4
MSEPKQDRAIKTRDEIIYAAASVFDERGYSGASMREIMKRAGVTLGAVYFHFENKEALARAVMNAQPTTVIPRLASQGLQRLVDLTLVWAHQLQANPVLRAGVRLTGEQAGFGMEDATPYQEWAQIMESCLLAARRDDELNEAVDSTAVAEFLVSACTGMQMYSHVVSGRSDLTARTLQMWQILLPSLTSPARVSALRADQARADWLNA